MPPPTLRWLGQAQLLKIITVYGRQRRSREGAVRNSTKFQFRNNGLWSMLCRNRRTARGRFRSLAMQAFPRVSSSRGNPHPAGLRVLLPIGPARCFALLLGATLLYEERFRPASGRGGLPIGKRVGQRPLGYASRTHERQWSLGAAGAELAAAFTLRKAGVAELVDALDLGSSGESRGGSNPSARTTLFLQGFPGPCFLPHVGSERGPNGNPRRNRKPSCLMTPSHSRVSRAS